MKTFVIIVSFILMAISSINAQWIDGQSSAIVLGTNGSYTNVGNLTAVGMAVDATNNKIYVSDYCNHAVYRFSLTNGTLSNTQNPEATFGTKGTFGTSNSLLKYPSGLGVDNNGRLYIVDGGNHRLIYIDNAATASSGIIFSGFFGQNTFTQNSVNSGAGSSSNHSFNFSVSSPSGIFSCTATTYAGYIAISSTNQIFVSDPGNNRVIRFDNISSSNADVVYGQNNFSGTNFATSVSSLNTPMGISINGNALYVADMNNNRVLRFDNATGNSTNGVNANAVYGQSSYTTATGGRSSSKFDIPINVATDASGTLYINDSNNGRTVYIKSARTKNGGNGVAVSFNGVLGQSNFTNYAGTASSSTMWAGVTGMAVNSSTGKLFLGNSGYGRMMQFNSNSALPVDFLFVEAKKVDNSVEIDWLTVNEINSLLFEVEYSYDGIYFNNLSIVKSHNVGKQSASYQVISNHINLNHVV